MSGEGYKCMFSEMASFFISFAKVSLIPKG